MADAAAIIPEALGEAAATHQRALGEADLLLAEAEGWAAIHAALSAGSASAPALSRHRLRQEGMAARLDGLPLVLAPSSVSVWIGGGLPPTKEQDREE